MFSLPIDMVKDWTDRVVLIKRQNLSYPVDNSVKGNTDE